MAFSVEENDRPDNEQKVLLNTNTNILCNFYMRYEFYFLYEFYWTVKNIETPYAKKEMRIAFKAFHL